MSLADKLVSSFLAFELDIDIQSPVHSKRTKALKEFEKLGFPTKKDEAWKYTSLKSVIKEDFTIFSKKKNVLDFKNVKNYFLDNTETYKIVFVDGFLILFYLKLVMMVLIFVFFQLPLQNPSILK
jgi:Fe-S cluster assembly protein SufD